MASSKDSRSSKISANVEKKLNSFSERSKDECISKILLTQRTENEKPYEPEMLSIGPFHHGKSKYRKLEMYKLEYLKEIQRRDSQRVEKCINLLTEKEREARNCYSRDPSFVNNSYGRYTNTNEEEDYSFVEMMLLDGCFIVEFLRKYSMDKEKQKDDHVFKLKWLVEIVCRDMLLFENQLPFFVLDDLFKITKTDTEGENLVDLAISCLNHCITGVNGVPEHPYPSCEPYHLLDLMYESWCSSFAIATFNETEEDQNRPDFLAINLEKMSSNLSQVEDPNIHLEFIKSVSELEEDGVSFATAKDCRSWLDIKFKDGVLKIPTLVVHEHTESILRNLIAFEEYMADPRYSGKVVSDYTMFMNCLVNSSKDVQTLRHTKVIKNLLGNDEVLSNMFNRFNSTMVSLNCSWFCYRKIFKDVNDHCSIRRNRWIADLKKEYFYSPWSITAFLAATVLLVLTLIQTIFTVL